MLRFRTFSVLRKKAPRHSSCQGAKLYPKWDSNPYSRYGQGILSPSCLPFHHSGAFGEAKLVFFLLIHKLKLLRRPLTGLSMTKYQARRAFHREMCVFFLVRWASSPGGAHASCAHCQGWYFPVNEESLPMVHVLEQSGQAYDRRPRVIIAGRCCWILTFLRNEKQT